jgi:hypothetical protein
MSAATLDRNFRHLAWKYVCLPPVRWSLHEVWAPQDDLAVMEHISQVAATKPYRRMRASAEAPINSLLTIISVGSGQGACTVR